MSAGQEFMIVSAACQDGGDALFQSLKNQPTLIENKTHSILQKFDIPAGEGALQFGSFDSLIRLTDDLQRYDSQVESIIRRLERQAIELDPNAQFLVTSQRQQKPFLDYLTTWTWDEAKYPKSRTITDNMALLMKAIGQFDDETRKKAAEFNDLKTQRTANAPKDSTALLSAQDLVDVFTPSKVSASDFVYSDYLDTVIFILPKGAEKEFLESYETFLVPDPSVLPDQNVIPGSAKGFHQLADKEGNVLFRVVCFKSKVEDLKKALREKRWLVRDFKYDAEAYEQLQEHRKNLDTQYDKAAAMMKTLYQAAWSDTMVAWVHLKAARIFVESVLRYGMPPLFGTFLISPKAGKLPVVRKAIEPVLGAGGAPVHAGGEDEEEVFPYISLSMTPFSATR